MKKYFALFLFTVMLFTWTFASAQTSGKAFTFRNGITWGMTPAEVEAAEGTEGQAYSLNGLGMMQYTQAKVSKFSAVLFYVFNPSSLIMSGYMIDPASEETFEYLRTALSTVYGSESDQDYESFVQVMQYLNPTAYTENEAMAFPLAKWEAPDGTWIWMVWENVERTNVIEIMYVSPEAQAQAIYETVNTSGL